MWSCPRSRSTAVARAFEQLDECVVFDEPFFGAYLVKRGLEEPCQEREVGQYLETNHQKIIQKITGSLPESMSFSFQKHQSKHALPEFGKNWLKSLNNFFLIRNPQEIIISYQKLYQNKMTMAHLGIEQHSQLFKEIESLTGKTPIVIDSKDIVKYPLKAIDYTAKLLAIANGELDYTVTHWEKNHQAFFERSGGEEKLERVGTIIPQMLQGYQIDRKTADKYNITNIEQLQQPEIAKLFDSDGDGKANLVG